MSSTNARGSTKVARITEQEIRPRIHEFHVLTYAEEGFAPLNIHGEPCGLSKALLVKFAEEVNSRGEAGSLHPRAPISAVPRRFIREMADAGALGTPIVEFLRANRRIIGAKRILCDFRGPKNAPFVLAAVAAAFASPEAECIDEVLLIG